MIFDATYTDRMVNLEMARLVGRPYGWLSKERWSGIGSERCRIVAGTGGIDELFAGDYRRNFTNIELRPKGIVIRIRYRLEVFAVAIPYGVLQLDDTDLGLLISTDQFSMTLVTSKGHAVNQHFLQKIFVRLK